MSARSDTARATGLCCVPVTQAALSKADSVDLAAVFAALSDPVRLRLLSIVAAEGEVCSCNLERPLGKSQPTVSHHTRVLSEVGLLEAERRGRWTWWRVVPGTLDALCEVLGAAAPRAGRAGRQPEPNRGTTRKERLRG